MPVQKPLSAKEKKKIEELAEKVAKEFKDNSSIYRQGVRDLLTPSEKREQNIHQAVARSLLWCISFKHSINMFYI